MVEEVQRVATQSNMLLNILGFPRHNAVTKSWTALSGVSVKALFIDSLVKKIRLSEQVEDNLSDVQTLLASIGYDAEKLGEQVEKASEGLAKLRLR